MLSYHQSSPRKWYLLLLLIITSNVVHAILPTAEIHVYPGGGNHGSHPPYTLYASQASFGTYLKMEESSQESQDEQKEKPLQLPPSDNTNLCINVTGAVSTVDNYDNGPILLTPRGECTFETKAKNAQLLGASGIIIYGTLSSRYTLNKTKYLNDTSWNGQYTVDDIVYPQNYNDYDCTKGKSFIDSSSISLDNPLPYNSQINDPILSGPDSMCVMNSPDKMASCPSKSCLLTGNKAAEDDPNTLLEACCAWDLHVWLFNDPSYGENEVTIPAVYITMEQSNTLLNLLQEGEVKVSLYERYRPQYNISVYLIWAMGVFVCALASYLSASEYRNATKHVENERELRNQIDQQGRDNTNRSLLNSNSSSSPPSETSSYVSQDSGEQLELGTEHAFGFIIMASCGLLILFFFKIYNIVKVMYAFGCSGAVTQVCMYPITKRTLSVCGIKDKTIYKTKILDIGYITLYECIAFILGYGLGLSWLIVAFTVKHAEQTTFFWITQDLLGACMCIMFLNIIKLNSIRVASLLLIVAFFYDIFFVFITPMIFKGQSVMITVATSGGPPKADPSWCEKYPDDTNCQGGDPLPMLLTVPRIGDYQGGASLLGLGDIVLPGLLLSFAARLDAAKNLIGSIGGGNGNVRSPQTCPPEQRKFCFCFSDMLCNGGYFIPLVIAYGIGLMMANAAVYLMNMGQPALLYLVPCCLGTMSFIGWKRNELSNLWHGPKVIKSADRFIYKDSPDHQQNGAGDHALLPTTDKDDTEGNGGGGGGGEVGLQPINVPSATFDNDEQQQQAGN